MEIINGKFTYLNSKLTDQSTIQIHREKNSSFTRMRSLDK